MTESIIYDTYHCGDIVIHAKCTTTFYFICSHILQKFTLTGPCACPGFCDDYGIITGQYTCTVYILLNSDNTPI